MDTPRIPVAFVDDHPGIRSHLRRLLTTNGSLEVVGEATNNTDMLTLCQGLQPAIVLLDLHMPGMPAPLLVNRIRQAVPQVKMLIVSEEDDDVYVRGMVRLPISGYVLKEDIHDYLLSAIHLVTAGATWYSPALHPMLRTL
jgi:DNA-binding NarL/FixJ family response regulator